MFKQPVIDAKHSNTDANQQTRVAPGFLVEDTA
jgi:hypothetical protein